MPRNIIQVNPDKFPWLDLRRYTFCMGVEKDGVAYLSGNTGSNFDKEKGRVAVKGDIAEQSKIAWEKIGVTLEAAGMNYSNVVKTTDYITPAGLPLYKKTADVRRQYLGNSPVASTGVVIHSLLRPEAHIEIQVVAAKGNKVALRPSGPDFAHYDGLTYSPGVEVGNKIWLSGVAMPGSDSTESQEEKIYKNIEQVLKAGGATFDDVVHMVEFTAPQATLTHPAAKNKLRDHYFKKTRPAASSVVVHRLISAHAHAEVDATAIIGAGREEIYPAGWQQFSKELRAAPAVKKGGMMYISAQGSIDYATGQLVVADHDLGAQARLAYKNLALICSTAGISMDDIAYTLEFTPPVVSEQVRKLQDVRKEAFGTSFPAATGITPHQLSNADQIFSVVAVAMV